MGRKKRAKIEQQPDDHQQQQHQHPTIPTDPRFNHVPTSSISASASTSTSILTSAKEVSPPQKQLHQVQFCIPIDDGDDNGKRYETKISSLSLPKIKMTKTFSSRNNIGTTTSITTTPIPITTTTDSKDKKESSSYGMHSHSGDLVEEDIYVSDGSEDEFENNNNQKQQEDDDHGIGSGIGHGDGLELLLSGSQMGLMRRGLSAQLFQPKIWMRQSPKDTTNNNELSGNTTTAGANSDGGGENPNGNENSDSDANKIKADENLTPAQRAAQLLAAKKQKEEELIIMKRHLESSENAGRDPCLFSKRTAFDIRMDQIEEKPWDRAAGGTADLTDYFNYGLAEEDWLDYSERQLAVRQELTDASRQRRSADPTVVPVLPKTPSKQAPKVAVTIKKESKDENENVLEQSGDGAVLGPSVPQNKSEYLSEGAKESKDDKGNNDDSKHNDNKKAEVEGGIWGAVVEPGSTLAKLIEQQQQRDANHVNGGPNGNNGKSLPPPPPPPPPPLPGHNTFPPHSGGPPMYNNSNINSQRQHFENDSMSTSTDGGSYYRRGGGHHQQHNRQQMYQQQGHPPPSPPFQEQQFPPPNRHAPPHGQFHHGRGFGGRGGRFPQPGRGVPPQPMFQQQQQQRGGRGHFGGRGGENFGGRGFGRGRGQFPGGRSGPPGGGPGYMRNNEWRRR
mmetsp:Transcript_17834/g.20604  ORF Transcript_17834/g.20604 Transcript_17834/m.20604 type:complete len:675 (-) Transcript_17834:109-2133(-)